MANRRMFSSEVVCTDKFLDMPSSSQALYFQFGMKADDDGFISAPKRNNGLYRKAYVELKDIQERNNACDEEEIK